MSPTSATILVHSADERTRRYLADNLRADGYSVVTSQDGEEALEAMGTRMPEVALLNLARADHAGLRLVERVRRSDRLVSPIDPELLLVVISPRANELDRLRAFDRGVDEFLSKPFSYRELRARLEALLRRARRRPLAGRIRIGALVLDAAARQAWLRGEPLALSNKEFALLRALAAEPTRAFTREELLRGVWGYRTMGATRTLDSHAARLRRKLRTHGDEFVISVWGVGYRLVDGVLDRDVA